MAPHRTKPESADPNAALLERLLQGSHTLSSLEIDTSAVIRRANRGFAGRTGRTMAALRGLSVAEVMTSADADRVSRWAAGEEPPADFTLLNFLAGEDSPFTLRCLVTRQGDGLRILGEPKTGDEQRAADELLRLNNLFATQSRELSRQTRELTHRTLELEQSREDTLRALRELEAATSHLRKIQETVPFCMRCSKVKSDNAEWEPLLQYLRSNRIQVSHGYCPACYEAVSREFGLEDE